MGESTPAVAAESPKAVDAPESPPMSQPVDLRYGVVTTGLFGGRHYMQGGFGHAYNGNNAGFSIGGGYFGERYFGFSSFDTHFGPWDPIPERQVIVDYSGTGASIYLGVNGQETSLRSPDGSYGFAIGATYLDTIGRSSGRTRKDPADFDPDTKATEDLIRNYSIHVTTFAVMPALFFAWLEPARPKGNTPDLLKTRMEGTILMLGFSLPVVATYSANYDKKPVGTKETTEFSERGQLKGYSMVLSYTALLSL